MTKKVEKIFAFLANNPEGQGLIAMNIDGAYVMFIGYDMKRIESLREHAKRVADEKGFDVELVVFENPTLLETIYTTSPGNLKIVENEREA